MKTAEVPLFLLVSGDYKNVLVALYKGSERLVVRYSLDVRLSSQLTLLIDDVLLAGGVKLADLVFIAATQGPGSFSHLRATLCMLNGISAASRVPLVGIDTMRAWCKYVHSRVVANDGSSLVVVAFDAYNKQIHYRIERISDQNALRIAGPAYDTIESVNALVSSSIRPNEPLIFAGHASLYIQCDESVPVTVIQSDDVDQTSACFAQDALDTWHTQQVPCYELQPLYLKETSFKKSLS